MESLDHLVGGLTSELDTRLAAVDALLAARYPGERAGRQPVHTVYVPADRFHPGLVGDHGAAALVALDEHEDRLVGLVDGDRDLVARVRAKLGREPVEDLRIDFEDGYGTRSDEEEDGDVRRAAAGLRAALDAGTAAPFTGIRFKGFEAPTRSRGLRTLTLFLAGLVEDGPLPQTFVVTLPKVTAVEQVEALVHVAARLETELGLDDRALRFEIQVETPQSILGPDGSALVARMVHASGGRCTGLHYGTYDYSAFCGIAAAHQSLEHPVADHAKAVMQAAAAGHRRTPLRRLHQRAAGRHAGRGRRRVGQPPATGPPLARARLLPGVGPPSGPAADALRGDVRVLPRRARVRGGPAAHLRRAPGLRRPRRAGDRTRARRLPAARDRLRRPVADRGDRGDRARRTAARRARAPRHGDGGSG